MSNTVIPAAGGAMPAPLPRRRFLCGLLSLPLIGGGVTLIGQPTAAAEPLTDPLLESYAAWLHFEMKLLGAELRIRHGVAGPGFSFSTDNPGSEFHGSEYPTWQTGQHASRRAAVVLSAVGCDWRAQS